MDITRLIDSRMTDCLLESGDAPILSVLQQVGDLILVIDRDCRVRYINHGDGIWSIGCELADGFSQESRSELGPILTCCFADRSPAHCRWCVNSNRGERWYDFRIIPTGEGDTIHLWLFGKDITNERQAEERTRISENILGEVLEMLPDAVALTSLDDGKMIEVNSEMERITGYTRAQMLGKTTTELSLWRAGAVRDRFVDLLSRDGLIRGLENGITTSDGRTAYGLVSSKTLDLGGRKHLITVIKDITERKALENELLSSQSVLSDIFDNMQDVYYRFDHNGRLLMASRSAARMFDVPSVEDAVGQPIDSFIGSRQSLDELRHLLGEYGRINDYEATLTRMDGRLLEASISCQALFDEDGCPAGMEGIIRDISERKKTERLLREHDENLSTLFNTIEEFLLVLDEDAAIIHANAAVCEAYGLPLAEIRGRDFSELTDPSYREAVREFIAQAGDPGERYHLVELLSASGELIPLEVRFLCGKWSGREVAFVIGRDIREWIDNQKALRDSEEKFSRAFRNNAAMMSISTLHEGRYIDVNERLLATLGYRREEMIGSNPQELGVYMNPQDFTEVRRRLLTEGQVREAEVILRARNGGQVVGLLYAESIDIGEEPCLLAVIVDVSARKAAEEALRLDEMRLETLLRLNQMTASTIREICDFTMRECIRLTGSRVGYLGFIDEEEQNLTVFTTAPCMELFDSADSAVIPVKDSGMWGVAARLRAPVIVNDLRNMPEGLHFSLGHFSISRFMSVPVFEGPRIVACIAVGDKETDYDDSEVRQLTLLMQGMWRILKQRKSEEERNRMISAIEQSDESVAITDTGFRLVYTNTSLPRLTGYSREELIGNHVRMLQTFEGDNNTVRDILDVLGRGEVWRGQLTVGCKDGSTFEQATSISPIRDQNGVLTNYAVVGRDISREVQLENQIRHVQKMEALGQLAGGIAHDFNNVLSAIIGSAEFAILEMNRKRDPHDLLKDILRASERASTLVRQLLTFSRKETLRVQTHNLNELVQGVLKMIKRVIGEHIEVAFLPHPDLGVVSVDAGQFENVLMNICINARDAMSNGGKLVLETGRVLLDHTFEIAHEWAKAGDYAWITITDSGTGIPPEVLEHIFEPFYTTKAVGHGTGLGLATVYGIVRQHGGLIHVYSEPGKGAQFKIYLPVSTGESSGAVTTETTGELAGGHETVLLAEDEPMVREMVTMVLSTAGYRVLEATNGEEAVEIFRKRAADVDLLLFDMVMPRLSGKAAADKILALRPELPVIFTTGYVNQLFDIGLTEQERKSLIPKPYDIRSLMQRVRDALDHAGGKPAE
jgi:PAS domain S-box-containing protein